MKSIEFELPETSVISFTKGFCGIITIYAASLQWGMDCLLVDVQERSTMTETVETQIINIEKRLRQAMLASDVRVLNELLAPEIIITSHLGKLLGKQDDLAAHESGLIKINELKHSEQHIQILWRDGNGADKVVTFSLKSKSFFSLSI